MTDAEPFFFSPKAHSGLFQFLPLGLRIQEKIERLLDKHMTRIGIFKLKSSFHLITNSEPGASKISLSTLSSEELWEKSGRLKSGGKEVFFIMFDFSQEYNF